MPESLKVHSRMRYILAILSIALLPNTISAQYFPNISLISYHDSGGERGVTEFIYNNNPRPYKAIWELADGTRWSENYHHFDKQGNLIFKYRQFSDSIVSKQFFRYDSLNNLIFESFFRSDSVTGKVTYNYSDNRCISAKCEGLSGWIFGTLKYIYNGDGLLESATLTNNDLELGTIQYGYDEKLRLVNEVWKFKSGFKQYFNYEYIDTYSINYKSANAFINTECGELISEEHYDYNNQGGGPSYYKYDSAGKLNEKIFIRADGFKTVTQFYYRENGLLERSVRNYNDGKTGTFTYYYDDEGRLIKRDFLRSDGVTAQEGYIYDRMGKLIEAEYSNFDGWLTGRLVFYHDRYDRICMADFIGKNGINAILTFEYKEHKNPSTIHWKFSDGKTQTYSFKYN